VRSFLDPRPRGYVRWRSFLRSLVKRGLGGVQLVVSDADAGLKAAIAQTLDCPWQRYSVHFLRETLGHVRKDQQRMVAALLRPIFNADDSNAARELVSDALDRLRTYALRGPGSREFGLSLSRDQSRFRTLRQQFVSGAFMVR
jgi:hypothetical protein